MKPNDYLTYVVERIHSVVAAATEEKNLPVTCVIDMMHTDNDSVYFLTAKVKNFYKRLKDNGYLALSGKITAYVAETVQMSAPHGLSSRGNAVWKKTNLII